MEKYSGLEVSKIAGSVEEAISILGKKPEHKDKKSDGTVRYKWVWTFGTTMESHQGIVKEELENELKEKVERLKKKGIQVSGPVRAGYGGSPSFQIVMVV